MANVNAQDWSEVLVHVCPFSVAVCPAKSPQVRAGVAAFGSDP